MGPKVAVTDYSSAKDAKHLLDQIGQKIQQIAHEAAKKYYDDLHGLWSNVTYPRDKYPEGTTPSDPCQLLYQYHTNVTSNVIQPCKHKSEKRFSDTEGAQCDKKIEGNDRKNGGACAPFRRLNLCNKNLEQIEPDKITTHNLLVDVCQAAKFEGESITREYPKYRATYNDSPSQICTMLARSFADIGDIIRGKDLYIGNKGEKKKLEEKLKEYFKKIYDDVTRTSTGEKKLALQKRYNDPNGNYYQLREDWWNNNRKMVWHAITCGAGDGNRYFRRTCGDDEKTATQASYKCRCTTHVVPTYFDYVPQFLRWFEEWAEDFCRKRKHKLQNAIKNCRGENNEKYCDLNGYDCKRTISAEQKLVKGEDCHKCSVVCIPFGPWIDNQKKEFEKQKEKYGNEISGKSRRKRSIGSDTYKGYDEQFYKILGKDYGDVETFLEKLSKEGICQSAPHVEEETADAADFTLNHYGKTFDHTTYCQACPWCGIEEQKVDGKWKAKGDEKCAKKEEKSYKLENITKIPVLTPEEGQSGILKKYNKFCKNGANGEKSVIDGGQIKNWQCYYDEDKRSDENDNCIQGEWENFKQGQEFKSYYSFFYGSIIDMLKDSVEWREKLNNCINNKTGKCKNQKCKEYCECFKSWIGEKEKEFQKIKDHFRKQKDIGGSAVRDMTLNITLNTNFLQDMEEAQGDPKAIKRIKELKEKKNNELDNLLNKNTIIDYMFEDDSEEAQKCLKTHNDENCKAPTKPSSASDVSRKLDPAPPDPEEDEDFEEEEDEDEEEDKAAAEAPPQQETQPAAPAGPDACNIVKDLFENPKTDFKVEACKQKYGLPQRYWGWKCVSSGDSTTTTGSICVPPRRRKLYIGKIKEWAETVGDTATQPQAQSDKLREAFIESAAVETFFLWDRYKKEWTAQKAAEKARQNEALGLSSSLNLGDDPDNPQKKLEGGEIPNDFLRLMFYTLADYKDILFSGSKDTSSSNDNLKNIVLEASGNTEEGRKEMQTIQTAISSYFSNSGKPENSVKTPAQWWSDNAPSIWNGMICALHYDTNDKTIKIDKEVLDKINNNNKYDDQKSKLEEITCTPQFIRWFEEWAEEFCRKRTYKLKKAKQECRGKEEGDKYCDGDGYDCTDKDKLRNESFIYLQCSDCQEQCIKYKKWIMNKKNQFNKQKKKFENEINNVDSRNQNKYDEGLYKNPKTMYDSFTHFVERLNKSAYCINSNVGVQIDFNKNGETFGSSEYCKACPVYGVTYNEKSQIYEPISVEKYNSTKTSRGENNDDNTPSIIEVLMLGRKREDENKYHNEDCKMTDLIEDASFQKWECQKKKGIDQCKLIKFDNDIDDDEEMEFNVFFQRWLRYFVQDYNKLKDKINPCIKNENRIDDKCIKGCKDKCDCVENWLKIKKTEWDNVKKHYNRRKTHYDYNIDYWVKTYFNQLYFDNDHIKAQDVVEGEEEQKKLWGCTGRDDCSEEEKKKEDDFITNLIDKLQKKIDECKKKHDETHQNCDSPPSSTSLENPETEYPEEDGRGKESPQFCPQPPPPPPPMTCVERAAKQLREEAEGKMSSIDDKLKGEGKDFNSECNKVEQAIEVQNSSKIINTDKLYGSILKSKYSCTKEKNYPLKIEEEWKFVNINKKKNNLYLPPRRQYMCTKRINDMIRANDSDKDTLLKAIMETAQNEGIDILKRINVENGNTFADICDAMKYSFADLADIIRGTDLWNTDPKQKRIQKKLELIFGRFNENLKNKNEKNYNYEHPNYLNLRSDWWDVNRKEVWKAMTCVAPNDSKFFKKDEKISSGSSSSNGVMSNAPKCGYNSEPPDYDYIPQPFRWMQEWSEYYCKLLNKELDNFKSECPQCKTSSIICTTDIEKCIKCKKQCKKYKELLEKWKNNFDKYKETYSYLYNNNNNKAKISSEEYFKKFLQKLTSECQDPKTVDEYLDKANNCINFTFREGNKNHEKYAFTEPPKDYVNACNCDPTDLLHECPFENGNENACKSISTENICKKKNFDNDLDDWTSGNIPNSTTKNLGILVPPRRRHLCLQNITTKLSAIEKKNDFKNELMTSAYNEGKLLGEKYNNDKEKALQAMKYSFADYGDIIKGTDMMDNFFLTQLKNKLDKLLKENGDNDISEDRGKWWDQNKNRIWYAILCGYNQDGRQIDKTECDVPTKDDKTPQFLRWFQEWTEDFCARRNELYNQVESACETATCTTEDGTIRPEICKKNCEKYRNFIAQNRKQYEIQMYQYKKKYKIPQLNSKKDPDFVQNKCNGKCECLSGKFIQNSTLENPYDTIEDDILKGKCDCIKIPPPPKKKEPKSNDQDEDQSSKPVPIPVKPPEESPKKPEVEPPQADEPFDPTILQTTIPFGVALALGSIAFLFLKKKTKASVGNLFQILQIPKSDYDIPTKLSPNRYIPYTSGKYRGKRYIYLEGDSGTDSGYTDHYSDITSSSESEYEELDINDIYVPRAPKYKTLIEVVLEPSGKLSGNTIPTSGKNTPSDTQNDIPTSDTPPPITDEEWNTLKDDFISNMLQNQPNTEPNMLGYNLDNNTNPKTLHVSMDEKPFIMSIHDKNLLSGEEYNYDMFNSGKNGPYSDKNDLYSGNHDSLSGNRDPTSDNHVLYSGNHHPYSGIDLINDSLSGDYDIYDELLKRKENELFGTEHHPKRTTTNHFATPTRDDPLHNQLELFHKWLDRHRDMCEKLKNDNERLAKLKEEWENETHSGNTHPSGNTPPTSDIPSGKLSDIPSDNNIHSDIHPSDIPSGKLSDIPSSNKTLNTDVSIQIHMDNPKPTNEFTYVDSNPNQLDDTYVDSNPDNSSMDTILEDLDKYNEPYYDVQDDIYYDVNDHDTSTVDTNAMDIPSKVQIEMDVNTKLVKEKYPIADVWDI